MSKKDYVAFAKIIKRRIDDTEYQSPKVATCERLLLNTIANEMCEVFAADNHLFDGHRFKVACGLIGHG